MTTTTDSRAGYTAGLRALADALDANPDLPLPYHGAATDLLIFAHSKAELAAYARVLGKAEKQVTDSEAYGFELHGAIRGVKVRVLAPRDKVCERVVRGTREVTRQIPDSAALAAVPTTTVTETVEDVEWVCQPILAEEPVSA